MFMKENYYLLLILLDNSKKIVFLSKKKKTKFVSNICRMKKNKNFFFSVSYNVKAL